MDRSTKTLIWGSVCAALVVVGGIANTYRLESKVQSLEAACAEQGKGKETKSPRFVPVCESKVLLELSDLHGIQAEIVAAGGDVSDSNKWPYVIAAGLWLLSALPLFWYFLLRRIRELREAIIGK